jgi:3',5'-cyclic-AMP phosphodiesterase
MIVAQISDRHVRPVGELYKGLIDSNTMLSAAVAHLNALDPRPQLVFVSGDLVEEGLASEYDAVRLILSGLRIPYRVIPGNHDEREAFREAFADHAYLPIGNAPLHYSVEELPVRLIALDSSVPGEHHGLVDKAGLEWLADTLAADPSRPTMVAMHHPPVACGIPYMDMYMCREPEAPIFGPGRPEYLPKQFQCHT